MFFVIINCHVAINNFFREKDFKMMQEGTGVFLFIDVFSCIYEQKPELKQQSQLPTLQKMVYTQVQI